MRGRSSGSASRGDYGRSAVGDTAAYDVCQFAPAPRAQFDKHRRAIIGVVNPEKPRNPLRNEADMFRVLIMFGVAAAVVIVVAVLFGSLAGLIVLAVLLAIGLWRTWRLIQDWRRYGSDPAER
jgi:hypothetical protein